MWLFWVSMLNLGEGYIATIEGKLEKHPKLKHKSVLCFSFLEVQVEELHGDFEPPFFCKKTHAQKDFANQNPINFNPQNHQNLDLQTLIFQLFGPFFFLLGQTKNPKGNPQQIPKQNWSHAQTTRFPQLSGSKFRTSMDGFIHPSWGGHSTLYLVLIGKKHGTKKKWMK